MIYNEAFDYLWSQLAGGLDKDATRRKKDYERKRLRRALLARSIKPFLLEAAWTNTTGLVNEQVVASTTPVAQPLIVLGGAIRTTDIGALPSADNNNFEITLMRTAGNSRVQVQSVPIKDEHLLTPAQAAIRNVLTAAGTDNPLGYGQPWPTTWPVPIGLMPNELLQLTSKVLTGGVPAGEQTFAQFRAVAIDNKAQDDQFNADLRQQIADNPTQRVIYLSMASENARSIAYPATGAAQRTTAKTREADAHLLVTGYATLFARAKAGGNGSTCDPKWRLSSSDGWAFSKAEIDINTYAYAGPGLFWQELPFPFLLPKGCSLAASFSTRGNIADALEQLENYVIFRCVSV